MIVIHPTIDEMFQSGRADITNLVLGYLFSSLPTTPNDLIKTHISTLSGL